MLGMSPVPRLDDAMMILSRDGPETVFKACTELVTVPGAVPGPGPL